MLHQSRRLVAAAVTATLFLAPACTRDDDKAAPAAASATASTTTTPTPKPTPKPKPKAKPKPKSLPYHPFVGGDAKRGEVVVVKVDNTGGAMPQTGLNQADVIYQELVEAGLTRLMAIYSTRRPATVGPVRSARETDIDILRPFGRVTLAYSGAQRGILRKVFAANLVNGRIDESPAAFHLSSSRPRPYSTYVNVRRMMQIKKGAPARDVGLRFGALGKRSKPARLARVRWSPSTRNEFRYDGGRWRVSVNGRPQLRVDNVIVQRVKVERSQFSDFTGANSPRTVLVGRGTGLLLRNGRQVPLKWAKPSPKAATTYTDPSGRRALLRPGTTYVQLLPSAGTVSVS